MEIDIEFCNEENLVEQFLPETGYNVYNYELDVNELDAKEAYRLYVIAWTRLAAHDTAYFINPPQFFEKVGDMTLDVWDMLPSLLGHLQTFYPNKTEIQIASMIEEEFINETQGRLINLGYEI